jgi:hypothetical protein
LEILVLKELRLDYVRFLVVKQEIA